MSTVTLNAQSIAYPSITNRIRADVSTQLDPLAIVASTTDTTAGHPARIWNFAGLPRTNYIFELSEIDGGGAKVRQLAYFDVVPSSLGSVQTRETEQIQVGSTTGLVPGATTFTFDGTGGKKDYRGWEIEIQEYAGVGTLIRGVDYSWDKVTGIFALMTAGAVLADQQWYTVVFEPINVTVPASVSTVNDFSIRIITASETLATEDFGTKLLVEPAGNYLELTMPPLATIITGRPLMIETKTMQGFACVRLLPDAGDPNTSFNFLRGNVYLMMNENLRIYKVNRGGGLFEFRVDQQYGNFMSVGSIIGDDANNIFNKVLLDGGVSINAAGLDVNKFARLYNDYVLKLPVSQRVTYTNWAANPTLFSTVDTNGFFRIPDRRGLVMKGNPIAGRLVGSYEADVVGPHTHSLGYYYNDTRGGDQQNTMYLGNDTGATPNPDSVMTKNIGTGISTETKVKNFSTNLYLLV